eukprot:452239_1
MDEFTNNSKAIVDAVNNALKLASFQINGRDVNKKTSTILSLLTRYPNFSKNFNNSTYVAEISQHAPLMQFNNVDNNNNNNSNNSNDNVENIEDILSVKYPTFLYCDAESKQIDSWDHNWQYNDFQTNPNLLEHEMANQYGETHSIKGFNKQFDHDKYKGNGYQFNNDLVNVLRQKYNILTNNNNDEIIGYLNWTIGQGHIHVQDTIDNGIHPLFGNIAQDMNGHSMVQDVVEDGNDDLETFTQHSSIVWIIGCYVIFIYITENDCIAYDDFYEIINKSQNNDIENIYKAFKTFTIFPLNNQYYMNNTHIIKGIWNLLPKYSSFKHNSCLWTLFFQTYFHTENNEPLSITQSNETETVKLLCEFVLNTSSESKYKWNENIGRYEQCKTIFQNITTREKWKRLNSTNKLQYIISNLQSIFKYQINQIIGTYDYVYNLLHTQQLIKNQLTLKHKAETLIFKYDLIDLFNNLINTNEFITEHTISAIKLEKIQNICLNNEYGVSDIFGLLIVYVDEATHPLIKRVIMLLMSSAAGWNAAWHYDWNRNDDIGAQNLSLLIQNCIFGPQKINDAHKKIPIYLHYIESVKENGLQTYDFRRKLLTYANTPTAEFYYDFLFDEDGFVNGTRNNNDNNNNNRNNRNINSNGNASSLSQRMPYHNISSQERLNNIMQSINNNRNHNNNNNNNNNNNSDNDNISMDIEQNQVDETESIT